MIAVAKGNIHTVSAMLKNTSLDVNAVDPVTGISSFWLAALYGHGNIMKLLAERTNCDILVTNDEGINVLHLAVYKNDLRIV